MAQAVIIDPNTELPKIPLSVTDDTYALIQAYQKLTNAITKLTDILETHG